MNGLTYVVVRFAHPVRAARAAASACASLYVPATRSSRAPAPTTSRSLPVAVPSGTRQTTGSPARAP